MLCDVMLLCYGYRQMLKIDCECAIVLCSNFSPITTRPHSSDIINRSRDRPGNFDQESFDNTRQIQLAVWKCPCQSG